jgi:hypothetical protein
MSDDTNLNAIEATKTQRKEDPEQPHAPVMSAVGTAYHNIMRGLGVREDAGANSTDKHHIISVAYLFFGCFLLVRYMHKLGIAGLTVPNQGQLATIFPLLMILGPETLHQLIATVSARVLDTTWYLPCFGMLGYSFSVLVSTWSNTTLVPKPEEVAKIINLKSGKARENNSFALWRVLRDLETEHPAKKEGLVIEVLEASSPFAQRSLSDKSPPWDSFEDKVKIINLLVFLHLILGYNMYTKDIHVISLVPVAIFLMVSTVYMPAWRAQHFSARKDGGENNVYALFRGKDHRYVSFVQNAHPDAWNMEDMAAPPEPYYNYSSTREIYTATANFAAWLVWTILLISLPDEPAAVMIVVLTIGTFFNLYNIYPDQTYGVPLDSVDVISHDKVISALQALEEKYPGFGEPLVKEFFPDGLSEQEKK